MQQSRGAYEQKPDMYLFSPADRTDTEKQTKQQGIPTQRSGMPCLRVLIRDGVYLLVILPEVGTTYILIWTFSVEMVVPETLSSRA